MAEPTPPAAPPPPPRRRASDDPVPVGGLLVAALSGLAVELLITGLTGSSESWDAPQFWDLGYPLTLVLCGALGAWRPRAAPLVGPLVLGGQLAVMVARNGLGPLFVVGLLHAGLLAAGGSLAALFGAWCRRHARETDPSRRGQRGTRAP